MDDSRLKLLGEIVGVLLVAGLLVLDGWQRRPRRATIALVGCSVVLFLAFTGLVVARFVVVAG